ncbi:cell surface protein [Candidatus Woesearchaeota archaeon]|nr:cell surface protein [Candidatus Woesearchaeota archaeon]
MTNLQKYLDKSVEVLDKYGFLDKVQEESQLAKLLDDIVDVDQARIVSIGKTVRHLSAFSDLVRDKVQDTNVSDRYGDITRMFDTIREDSKKIISQLEDGKIDFPERMSNWWMRFRRGTTHARFEKIKNTYESVSNDTKEQLDNENEIMNAYIDFRFALKEAEILSQEVLQKQTEIFNTAKEDYKNAAETIDAYKGEDVAEKSRLELKRDEAKRLFDEQDRKYQLIKDVAENLSMGYNVGETLVAKLKQTHDVKEQVYRRSVTFFTTNEHVFTTLDAVYTSQLGLHETTQTLEAMKEGANKGLEDIAELGRELERAALKAGYGSVYNPKSVQKLVDAIVSYQEESIQTINQLRIESTQNAREIEKIVDEGKKRAKDAVLKYTPQIQAS